MKVLDGNDLENFSALGIRSDFHCGVRATYLTQCKYDVTGSDDVTETEEKSSSDLITLNIDYETGKVEKVVPLPYAAAEVTSKNKISAEAQRVSSMALQYTQPFRYD